MQVRAQPSGPDETINYGLAWIESILKISYEQCMSEDRDYDDAMYGCQTGMKAINVESVWDEGVTGEGVNVVVVDLGVDFRHENMTGVLDMERMGAYKDAEALYDINRGHGTAMAGIIAARHDSTGTRGVAPAATVYSYRQRLSYFSLESRSEIGEAMLFHHTEAAVSSNSWGVGETTGPSHFRSRFAEAMERGVAEGFYGKGTSYVFAVSRVNENSNYSDLENYYGAMAVCGVDGEDSFPGSADGSTTNGFGYGYNIWLCGPKDAFVSDRHNYYRKVEGTSPPTAMVSGVVALIRSVNPELTWRDVKLILADSARKNDPGQPGWMSGAKKYGSGQTYWYNPNYGFGVLDAHAAVELARGWTNLPPMAEARVESPGEETIYEGTGHFPLVLEAKVQDDGTSTPLFVEHVELNMHIEHDDYRGLAIDLVSPSGVVSHLSWPDDDPSRSQITDPHSYGSAAHMGENPVGTWQIIIEDKKGRDSGRLIDWTLVIRGHRQEGDGPSPALWSSVLTVGKKGETDATTTWGYSRYTDIGSVEPNYFIVEKPWHYVGFLLVKGGQLYLGLNRVFSESFTLDIGGRLFNSSDSTTPRSGLPDPYIWDADDLGWEEGDEIKVRLIPTSETRADPTAKFVLVPKSHNGLRKFKMRLYFSEELPLARRTLRDGAVVVDGGALTSVRRVEKDRNMKWVLEVEPDGLADVYVSLVTNAVCGEDNAICTGDGRSLRNAPSDTVPAKADSNTASLTGEFLQPAHYHDGLNTIAVWMQFSEPVTISYKDVKDVVTVINGEIKSVRRVDKRSDLWEMVVTPVNTDLFLMMVESSGSCEADTDFCGRGGNQLEEGFSMIVPGPTG